MELKILEVELISECGKLPQLPLDVILIIHWQPAGPLCRSSLGLVRALFKRKVFPARQNRGNRRQQ